MLRRLARWAAVPVCALALSTLAVVNAPAAGAAGSCFIPFPLAGVGAGAFTSPNDYDAWQYPVRGTTTISLAGKDVWMRVYTGSNCSGLVCASTLSCTVTASGAITVQVGALEFGAAYVLSTVTTALAAAPCSHVNTGGVCVGLTVGGVREERTVYGVTTTPWSTHQVGGWVDAYRFPLATGGSTVLPCVVLKVDTQDGNPCAEAGGTFVQRRLTLVEESVELRQVVAGAPALRVRVCDATFTATAGGYGVENVPVLSTC